MYATSFSPHILHLPAKLHSNSSSSSHSLILFTGYSRFKSPACPLSNDSVFRRVKCLIKSTEENEQEIVNDDGDGVDQAVVNRSERLVTDSPTLGIREPIYEVLLTLIFSILLPPFQNMRWVLIFCTHFGNTCFKDVLQIIKCHIFKNNISLFFATWFLQCNELKHGILKVYLKLLSVIYSKIILVEHDFFSVMIDAFGMYEARIVDYNFVSYISLKTS